MKAETDKQIKSEVQKIKDEISKMKICSIALINQITTISKKRIFDDDVLRKVRLSRCYRWFLFVIMISIEGIMNVTNGLLSSATKEIIKNYSMFSLSLAEKQTVIQSSEVLIWRLLKAAT